MPALAFTILIVASALSTISGILMLHGSIRTRTSDGLAFTMLILNLFTSPMWVAYAIANHNYLMTFTSLLWSTVTALWWGFWLTDRGRPFWWAPAAIAVWTAVWTVSALTVIPFATFGWIAGFVGVVSSVPQMIALWRAEHLGDGFDLRAWAVSAASLIAWTAYGLTAMELPILIPDSIALLVSAGIVWRATVLKARTRGVAGEYTIDWDSDTEWALLEDPTPTTELNLR